MHKALLRLLTIDNDAAVEIVPRDGGLLVRKLDKAAAYEAIAEAPRTSLDKLAE